MEWRPLAFVSTVSVAVEDGPQSGMKKSTNRRKPAVFCQIPCLINADALTCLAAKSSMDFSRRDHNP